MTTAVAMSGGVDSSTVAALLSDSKECLVGLTMQLWNQRRLPALQTSGSGGNSTQASGRCCSLDDVYDARRVANFLGIPYYVVNFERDFEAAVVRPFVEQYLSGGTPIPCSLCNTEIKFEQFVTTALQIGADCVATGHYARLRRDEATGRYRLYAATDRSKDQSYFLFGLTQAQLARSIFPLGDLTKQQVRSIARQRNLPVADKPDSQEICFVPNGSYRDFIQAYLAEQGKCLEELRGEVVTSDGRVLAEHSGIHKYTVGQRKGLGIAAGSPLYVLEIDRPRNRVVVGPDEELFRPACRVGRVNWIRPPERACDVAARVKIRNKHVAAEASIHVLGDGEARVDFLRPQRAITPGQAAVFYGADEEVLGGGWISQVL
jgi:tRNA-specific 2-thiouridylase